ncbi:signal peptidase I [Acidiferrimicrobium sp. IK]|uniref:signal peptidase I n=1 Tax=Acidiferrimicrobium sp. IK TaxID=2871700 RepID=UPI0021CB3F03|nr:signal peptidase I [Acidiferrimicrobium sp. IK]MCU4184668.1 signal peptidase I [Acidiferrimicrobium sp. IK]
MAEPAPTEPPAGRGAAPGDGEEHRGRRRVVIEWGAIIAVAVVLTLVVRAFVFEAYFIPSGSMEPTLKPGNRVLVDKLSYDLHSVHRGDIVVFSRPPTETNASIKDLIKRVIGLPGDTIQSGPNGEIFIDGKLINQPWLTSSAKADPGPPVPKLTLPRNEYYVMGDNRGDSEDSRYIGPISGNLIVGRAVLRVWPITSIKLF